VQEKTKHHLLDTLAAIISGSRRIRAEGDRYIESQGGTPEALCRPRILTSAVNAALANGMCAHADETDDSHAPPHPSGVRRRPGALALAERIAAAHGAPTRRGARYDICARLSMSLGDYEFRDAGIRPHFGPTSRSRGAGSSQASTSARFATALLHGAAGLGVAC